MWVSVASASKAVTVVRRPWCAEALRGGRAGGVAHGEDHVFEAAVRRQRRDGRDRDLGVAAENGRGPGLASRDGHNEEATTGIEPV